MDPPRRPELQRSKTLDPSSPSLTTSRTVLDDITGRINLAGGPSLRVAPAFVEETEELDRTRLLTPRSRSFGLRRANSYSPASLQPPSSLPSSPAQSDPSSSPSANSTFFASPPSSPSFGCLRAPSPLRRSTSEGPRSPRLS